MMEEEMSAGRKRGSEHISNVTAETNIAYEKFVKSETEEKIALDNMTKMMSDHFPDSDWYIFTDGIYSPSPRFRAMLECVTGPKIDFRAILIFNNLMKLRKLNGNSAISKDDFNTSRPPLLLEDAVDDKFIYLQEGKVTLHPNSRSNCEVDSPTMIYCDGSYQVLRM